MGAILDHHEAETVADRHQAVHVADMSAHVRQQKDARARGLGLLFQMGEVDGQVFGDLHEDRGRADGGYGTGHRGKGKGVGQHPVPRANPDGAQGTGHGIAARGHGKAVARAREGGEFLFQQGSLGQFAGGGVVAMQPPVAQHGERGFDPLIRDRLLLGEAAREAFHQRTSLSASSGRSSK